MSASTNKRTYTRKPNPLYHNVPLSNILLTNAEAAKFLRIGIKQLKYYRDHELLPFIQKIKNGRVLFDQTDLEQFVIANRHTGKFLPDEVLSATG
jgi:hypothetical protein